MTSGASATNSAAYLRKVVGIAFAPAINASMRTLRPSAQPNCASPCNKRRVTGPRVWIVRAGAREHADPSQPLALLRARCERPRSRTAKKRDELAPSHCLPRGSDNAS